MFDRKIQMNFTMKICSISLFGVNAELLDRPCMGVRAMHHSEQVKAYQPETNSVSSGQVLHCPYDFDRGKADRKRNDRSGGA